MQGRWNRIITIRREEVLLDVGDDFQATIDDHEPGTRYRIAAMSTALLQV